MAWTRTYNIRTDSGVRALSLTIGEPAPGADSNWSCVVTLDDGERSGSWTVRGRDAVEALVTGLRIVTAQEVLIFAKYRLALEVPETGERYFRSEAELNAVIESALT